MRDADNAAWGAWLREIRVAAGHTQKTLGEAIGVPRTRINKWENGRNVPDGRNLVAIIQACGLTLQEGAPPLPVQPDMRRALLRRVGELAEAVEELQHELGELPQSNNGSKLSGRPASPRA